MKAVTPDPTAPEDTRKIIHLDCDCFFAAVEMLEHPEWRDIPLAVGGSAERRGVISTCNYPAREFGIHSAMSSARALQLCPQLKLVSGNMARYREVAEQIFAVYRRFTSLIEPVSIDEAYLDVTDSGLLEGSATRIAEAIRQQVREETGITVSAGVAQNKFLAKVASDWDKPDGLCVITPEQQADFVARLPVKKIPGVGPRTQEKLMGLGVGTCAELQSLSLIELQNHFGKFGERLWQLARGEDSREVRTHRERKSVSTEHTYSQDLPDLASCLDQLDALMQDLAARYERHRESRQILGLVVKVKFNDFSKTTAECRSEHPHQGLFASLLEEAWHRGARPVRLLGVGYRLGPKEGEAEAEQLPLF
ncbi:DNA polymerase IV [Marinobacterium weihaiense]|uniref:DNA polymerase IV n=1 Tax=Marinobacterium weihaiense TaxID=2851016 RepID=A0ABS6M977_9GAMM|nr:DNA polymerase IV [Marinobacterium weihaiense]MBV0932832.1 DNA polymerase IV [Marinobacterium weihaiense]